MKVIYPEKTQALLDECDRHLQIIREGYQKEYESQTIRTPEWIRDWQRRLLEDSDIRRFNRLKVWVIERSTCTYQFDNQDAIAHAHWLKKEERK